MEIDVSFLSNIDPRILRGVVIAFGSAIILLFVMFIVRGFLEWFWLPGRQVKYINSVDYVLLAIDIPKENEQSPKAVEGIFTTLSGTYSGPNKKEYYLDGKVQLPFSLEIVSLDGYIQFLIRTPSPFRDLVEGAIFAQYPDAEITEVNDYVNVVPEKFPDDTYDLWGTELTLFQPDAFPIRTYPYFEHSLSQEFKDPMAALLEVMSRLGQGEQAWLQYVITPIKSSWIEKGNKEVKKLIGEKVTHKKTLAEKLTDPLLNFFHWSADTIVVQAEKNEKDSKPEPVNRMQHLTPGEQLVLTAMQTKLSKIGFSTTARFIYTAPKSSFSKAKGVASIMGALSQFNSLDLNSFVPAKGTKTGADYVLVDYRVAKQQNKVLKNYRNRLGVRAAKPFIFNTEELATVFHFPDINVKAPLVKKTEAKRSEPPVALPTQILAEEEVSDSFGTGTQQVASQSTANEVPDELRLDLANTHFEERFASNNQPNSQPTQPTPAQTQTRDAAPIQQPAPKVEPKKENKDKDQGVPPSNLPI
ncbi:MAG: hypothetical protein ACPGO5_04200 [Patescibacteria group bacterium]